MKGTPNKNPTEEINKFLRNWAVNNIETIDPAVIVDVSNYGTDRTVSVQPLIMELGEDGIPVLPPVIYNCPVMLTGGKDGYSSHPVAVGDTVAVGYCKRSVEEVTYASNADPLFPEDLRVFGCSDAIVLGTWAQSNDYKVSTTDWETRFKDGYIRITPNNDISIENPNATETMAGDGTKTFTNGSVTVTYNPNGTADITASSTVTINGTVVNPDGSVDFASGAQATASGDFVTVGGASLQSLYDAYIAHGAGAPNHPPPAP